MNFIFWSIMLSFVAHSFGYRVEVIKGPRAFKLGEGPHWDAVKQDLMFVDIESSKVYRYVPTTGKFYNVSVGGRASTVIPIFGSRNKYLLGMGQEFKIMEWDGYCPYPASINKIQVLNEVPSTRINDGKCDPTGRLFVGTYDESGGSAGNLYRFDYHGHLDHLQSNISISNGFAWTRDSKTMYYIDSATRRVDAFDYAIETGAISRRRSVFNLSENGLNKGVPDGMTIDSDGNIWVAVFGGSQVLHINPQNGSLLGQIDFSKYASQITSVAFGGKNLDILYVTSAALDVGSEPFAGSLFAVHDLGVKGAGAGIPFMKKFGLGC